MTLDFSPLTLTAGLALAALLGWTARVRARAHRSLGTHRRLADSFVAVPTVDWISLEVALGWL